MACIRIHIERDWKAPERRPLWRRIVRRLAGIA